MLAPKKVKHRKCQKNLRHIRAGVETRGSHLAFGDYGLMVLEPGWITSRQIEAARVAINRKVKRGGKLWIRFFPDKPLTKKPAEVRMGKGKGAPELWVAAVRAGKLLYEVKGVEGDVAKDALQLASAKLPLRTKVVCRSDYLY